jgi:sarcosine oxidase subunit beta
MFPSSAQVVVIGAGIIGASIAYHLAARGCTNVVLLEKEITEITGSSARSAAGLRHQFTSAVNIELSLYGIERIKHFTEEIGGHADFKQNGYLFLISDPQSWDSFQQAAKLQQSYGIPTQLLTPSQVSEMVPFVTTDDLIGASFCAWDGYCDAHGIAMGYLNRARELGVTLLRETQATGFERQGERIIAVHTNQGSISCDYVVNATGSWAGEVGALAGLEIPVKPYRRMIFISEPFAQIPNNIPMIIDDSSGFYLRKEHESLLFSASNPNEPSSRNQTLDWEWFDQVLDMGFARCPVIEHARLAEKQCWTGFYEITPDHMPILGKHPHLPNYIDASGFSGHGIMHSPATGLLMAEEILDGRAHTINIDELRIDRYLNGSVTHERNIY